MLEQLTDDEDKETQRARAREALLKSFKEKEENLHQVIAAKDKKIDELYAKLKALKRYARQVKNCAEELLPPEQPAPDILVRSPPLGLEDGEGD